MCQRYRGYVPGFQAVNIRFSYKSYKQLRILRGSFLCFPFVILRGKLERGWPKLVHLRMLYLTPLVTDIPSRLIPSTCNSLRSYLPLVIVSVFLVSGCAFLGWSQF